jgi:hypothetical protein
VSNAEQGDASVDNAPREGQIEDEIAEIKRYEVSKGVCGGCMYIYDPL